MTGPSRFGCQLNAGDVGGEVLQNLHVDVHTHPCGDGDEQGVGGHDGGVGAASETDTRFSIKG